MNIHVNSKRPILISADGHCAFVTLKCGSHAVVDREVSWTVDCGTVSLQLVRAYRRPGEPVRGRSPSPPWKRRHSCQRDHASGAGRSDLLSHSRQARPSQIQSRTARRPCEEITRWLIIRNGLRCSEPPQSPVGGNPCGTFRVPMDTSFHG